MNADEKTVSRAAVILILGLALFVASAFAGFAAGGAYLVLFVRPIELTTPGGGLWTGVGIALATMAFAAFLPRRLPWVILSAVLGGFGIGFSIVPAFFILLGASLPSC